MAAWAKFWSDVSYLAVCRCKVQRFSVSGWQGRVAAGKAAKRMALDKMFSVRRAAGMGALVTLAMAKDRFVLYLFIF